MNQLCLLLLPLMGLCLGGLIFFIGQKLLFRYLKKHLSDFCELDKMWQSSQIESEMEDLLHRHIDQVVEKFKEAIPIASMFLSQEREKQLKELALQELILMIPKIKHKALNHLSADLTQASMEVSIKHIFRRFFYPSLATAAALGFAFGIIEMILFSILCH